MRHERSRAPLVAQISRNHDMMLRMATRLTRAVTEVERHAAGRGWDQPPRLYALVPTGDLLTQQRELTLRLGLAGADPAGLTPIEQEALPGDRPLDDVLAAVAWPAEVAGCALVVERLMLPPGADADAPTEGDLAAWVANHPGRQEVRIAVGVLRDGSRDAAVRLRTHDADADVLSGPALVPALADALAATLDD
ncbi:PPA1309 family protein [soil metagenome]